MSPQQFIAKWQRAKLTERSAAQQHFLDLCELLEQEKPAAADPEGAWYTFERGVAKTGGGDGWADVWRRGCFAWEYKGRHKDLQAAYQQLLLYREDLENPPLLVVCDMDRFEVHTNFTDTVKQVHAFDLAGLADTENLDVLRKLFADPNALRPNQTRVGITEAAAAKFGEIADIMRGRKIDAEPAAHFLMKIIFCLFAQHIGLLPKDLFSSLLHKARDDRQLLARVLKQLFSAMTRGGTFGADVILHFNGGLFADAEVIDLRGDQIDILIDLSRYDWSCVEPSIFGTLFERTLDPDKRAQIGAHYTSKQDILTLVEPVLMKPLRAEWAEVRALCNETWKKCTPAPVTGVPARKAGKSSKTPVRRVHDKLLTDFAARLASVRVLDPACGSGNFLYVAIQLLLDLEKEVIAFAAGRGLNLSPHVRPTQLSGIEINTYAHELASVVLWIGYLQWMHLNGFPMRKNPVLEPIGTIRHMDAILDLTNSKKPTEPDWPKADVVIGNPPFLGGKLLRAKLGDDYVDRMFKVWDGRVPREADLCCYWFEKARATIKLSKLKRAGLLATQGIRGGANREVLKQIKDSGDIFFAESDRNWILDGANVHVSMIGFDDGTDTKRILDGVSVSRVNPDLTSESDLTATSPLPENRDIAFMGDTKGGAFDISASEARQWIALPNPNGKSNRDVLRPWTNGLDVTRRSRDMWIIDFGCNMSLESASQYERPFEHVRTHVKPERDNNKRDSYRQRWWLHVEPRPAMRAAFGQIDRFVATPNLTKFRLFTWMGAKTLPDHQLIVFARDDDYFFGVLHSVIHERWSRRMGTQLREAESGCRYTPTTCFETFPFPPLSGGIAKAPDEAHPRSAVVLRDRIALAAKKLVELRDNWLNPTTSAGAPALSDETLRKRTLTNLYNDRPTWLELAHLELDRAVLAAYGWPEDWAEKLQPRRDDKGKVNPILGVADPAVEQEVLSQLLTLNLAASEV